MRPWRPPPVQKRRTRVRRQNVERGGLNALLDRPVNRAVENSRVVIVHTKDKAAIDHHAQFVQPPDGGVVVAVQVLMLVLLAQVCRVERLEADKEAAQPCATAFSSSPGLSTD